MWRVLYFGMTDSELLERFCTSRCDAAFSELVERYIDLVYSAAWRQVGGDAHLAQDVTQAVFIDLARKAPDLAGRTLLGGWLYTSTRYAAAKAVRSEKRWAKREQQANTMQQSIADSAPEPAWDQLRPVLDAAMHELNEPDRNAVLLRYFEGRPLGEIGAHLGVSEDAARKRVDRSLDKLRQLLAKQGLTSTTAALISLLSTQVVGAAPAGLAAQVAGVALASTATATGSGLTLLKIMTMTKLKLGVLTVLLVTCAAAPLLIQRQAQIKLRQENLALRRQNNRLVESLVPLAAENVRLSNSLAQAGSVQPAKEDPSKELLKLRGEVARLRADSRESARMKSNSANAGDAAIDATAQELAERASQLKQALAQRPNLGIPELQFLKQKDWLDAVSNVPQLSSDEAIREALNHLRSSAKANFGAVLQQALRAFTQLSGGMLPTDLTQLQPYMDSPVDPALLGRYQLLQTGKLTDEKEFQGLIGEIAPPVDNQFDTEFVFGLNGTMTRRFSQADIKTGEGSH